jgi:hypothetical protein
MAGLPAGAVAIRALVGTGMHARQRKVAAQQTFRVFRVFRKRIGVRRLQLTFMAQAIATWTTANWTRAGAG